MPASSPLKIATQSVERLVKEEASYHKELKLQEQRIASLKVDSTDENAEYLLRQENRAIDETKAMFAVIQSKIKDALVKLEREIENGEGTAPSEELDNARVAVTSAKTGLREEP